MRPTRFSPLLVLVLVATGCGSSSKSEHQSNPYAAPAKTPTSPRRAAAASSRQSSHDHNRSHEARHVPRRGSQQRTVYLFDADHGKTSTCYGKCAVVWPPVLGTATAVDGARASELGSTRRKDGSEQVTYKGHPLYYFVKDKATGDTVGAGINSFGAKWYVLMPSGSKIDNT